MSLLPVWSGAQIGSAPYAFTTLAGRASIGSEDGPGATARFAFPDDVAVDRSGNLYVADTDNHTVRKISPNGTVTTLAGLAGVSGAADGIGSAARFNTPEGIAVDTFGVVYVADTGNLTIRKITPAGAVTTFAGTAGTIGSLDGIGTAAAFNHPSGVGVDSAGNVYVAETINNDVRMITPAGVVTTLAGIAGSPGNADGPRSTARFTFPRGVAVDAWGHVLVADSYNDRICEITPARTVTTLRLADGTPVSVDRPQKLCVDMAYNVFVSESSNHRVWRLTPTGKLAVIATLPADPPLDPASVPYADGLAADTLGNLYLADTGNSAIRRVTSMGVVTTVAGFGPAFGSADGAGSTAQFYFPAGIATDGSSNLYVADSANHTIRRITPAGVVTTVAGLAGAAGAADGVGSAARFLSPAAVTVDSAGNVLVADTGNRTIRRITPAGVVTTVAGLAGASGSVDAAGSAARFLVPEGLAVDTAGNVYVADTRPGSPIPRLVYNAVIRKITPAGEVTTLPSLCTTRGFGSTSVAVDRAGNIYAAVPDVYTMVYDTSAVFKVTPDGTVSVLAGSITTAGGDSVDGTGEEARFTAAAGVAVDAAGNLYVTDNHAVRGITPAGVVTTLAGLADIFGSADGVGSAVRFNAPTGIAMDNVGRLYVADTDNHTIRVGVAASAPVIVTQPQSQAAASGANVQFSVTVAGVPEPTLQWFRNGAPISGATGSTLTLPGVLSGDASDYTVTATNDLGSATSNKAALTVTSASSGTAAAGGGGAMELWFVLVLLGLTIGRRLGSDRRPCRPDRGP